MSKLHFSPKSSKSHIVTRCFRMHGRFNARNWKNTNEFKLIVRNEVLLKSQKLHFSNIYPTF